MRVIYKEPMKDAEIRDIKNELEELQGLVGGWIEHVPLTENVGIIVNEEGKLHNLTPNFYCGRDVIVGPAIFVGESEEDFTDLTEIDMEKVKAFLQWQTI